MTNQTPVLNSRQQTFVQQYAALKQSMDDANGIADALGRLRLGPDGAAIPLTPTQQSLYDQAKQRHIDAHAELTAFLRDTSSNLGRVALQYDGVANNPTKDALTRESARQIAAAYAEAQGEFLAFKASQGWKAPDALEYQIGQNRVLSNAGGVNVVGSPTDWISGFTSGIRQWVEGVNTAGAANAQVLKEAGITFTDEKACLQVLGKLRSAILQGPFGTPDLFKNSPALIDSAKTVGERIYDKGIGSVVKVEQATCDIIFNKQDLRQMMQKYGAADDGFMRELDALSVDEIRISVSRTALARVLAADAVLDDLSPTDTLGSIDARVQGALSDLSSAAGLRGALNDDARDTMLDALDGATFNGARFKRIEDQLRVETRLGERDVVLLASIDDAENSTDAGGGLQITGGWWDVGSPDGVLMSVQGRYELNGEYRLSMMSSDGSGGRIAYERKFDPDFGFIVKQTWLNPLGDAIHGSSGYQGTPAQDVQRHSEYVRGDADGDGMSDRSEYVQYDGGGRVVGRLVESAAASSTGGGALDIRIDQLHQAMAREDDYVLEVASLRRLVGAQGASEAWAGMTLLRASNAPEQYVQGFETLESVLADHAVSLWLEGLKPTEWTGLRNNSMIYSEAAATPSAAPGTGWQPASVGRPGADWAGTMADWFDTTYDHAQVDRLGALYAAMGEAFGFATPRTAHRISPVRARMARSTRVSVTGGAGVRTLHRPLICPTTTTGARVSMLRTSLISASTTATTHRSRWIWMAMASSC